MTELSCPDAVVRANFERVPPADVRQEWCEWLRHHTIDPAAVAVPGFIEMDAGARRIRYLTYNLNDAGRKYLTPDGEYVATSIRVVQLEARPSPFPRGST